MNRGMLMPSQIPLLIRSWRLRFMSRARTDTEIGIPSQPAIEGIVVDAKGWLASAAWWAWAISFNICRPLGLNLPVQVLPKINSRLPSPALPPRELWKNKRWGPDCKPPPAITPERASAPRHQDIVRVAVPADCDLRFFTRPSRLKAGHAPVGWRVAPRAEKINGPGL